METNVTHITAIVVSLVVAIISIGDAIQSCLWWRALRKKKHNK